MKRKHTVTFFSQVGKRRHQGTHTRYYYCNRSGFFAAKSSGKRHMKSQGTSKLNTYCTASITATLDNGLIRAQICNTHYGHNTSLGHLRLSESDRSSIAGQLAQGVKFEHILDSIRDNVGTQFHRLHLLTRQDLVNIERSYGLQGIERHKDDATSVSIWVQEMAVNGENNPVLLYKQQGEPQPKNCDNLDDEDFALVLQTPTQTEMLKEFGKIICIDSTHGTNGYDFNLITILVIDEFGEGFPVGWCISNREDLLLMINFYAAIKSNVDTISPEWIMSDDAEQFYTT